MVAQNVVTLRDRKYRTLPNLTLRNQQLAKDADVSYSQIVRVTKALLGPSVDTVEALAKALEVRPQDLLTPYFQPAENERRDPAPSPLQRRQSA